MSPLTNEQMASDLPAAKVSVNRLNVVGSSGGGKSTAGKLIAKKLGYP
jgi:ABC-type dipeptide/oligopeptide/nickel transport system ATPase subunit